MAKTIYDPADPNIHADWARRQEAFETEAVGDRTLGPAAAGAAGIQNVIGQKSQLIEMWGLDQRSAVSLYQPPPGYLTQRSFSLNSMVPELGSIARREANIDAIERELGHVHPGENSVVQQEALAILGALEETISHDRLIGEVRGRMGELVAG